MSRSFRLPLLAKVLCWLALHLLILGLAFLGFVRWQLGFGLDSLLSGSAGARLADFGDQTVARLIELPRNQWNREISRLAREQGLQGTVWTPRGDFPPPFPIPDNVDQRARGAVPPGRGETESAERGPSRRPFREDDSWDPEDELHPPPGRMPEAGFPDPFPPDDGPPARPRLGPGASLARPDPPTPRSPSLFLPKSRPVFLVRGDQGDGYWAGILIHFPAQRELPRRPLVLLLRADRLDGAGMFFDFKPWLLGGIAVLALSLAFWTPFVWSITRYVRRLTAATDQISAGRFQITLPKRSGDELAELGRTVESMASRLDHLITGQKRFLGDAAHELCAPLARIRTGLGILEQRIPVSETPALESIEADVAELAVLTNEILAFSRAGNRSASRETVNVRALVDGVLAREAADVQATLSIPGDLSFQADPALASRAVGNLIRNAAIHAGPKPAVEISAAAAGNWVDLSVRDNGPGVPEEELSRIFEPFYRLDRSRSRDTGGSGLGLAIVRNAVETCGGEVAASTAPGGGLAVRLRFPAH